jgi:hypothetical protein
MIRSSPLPPEEFDRFLNWLAPNRETAAAKHLEIHQRLTRYFSFKCCICPEDLADVTMDRVARKVLQQSMPAFSNDDLKWFHGFAKNVYLEYVKDCHRFVSLELVPGDALGRPVDSGGASAELQQRCLDRCLSLLADTDRGLLLEYYQYAPGKKIPHRKRIAEDLRITLNALRIRICRLQSTVGYCVKRCIGSEGPAAVQ